jgi:hypothetical protein
MKYIQATETVKRSPVDSISKQLLLINEKPKLQDAGALEDSVHFHKNGLERQSLINLLETSSVLRMNYQ